MNKVIEKEIVSVAVITYNSELYILETLNSIKKQTYKNLELIISDDSSKDKTIELCNKWVENNSDRFLRVELITVKNNTGVASNCNRGLKASRGKWIKFLAGDDLLLSDCIENNVNYFKNNLDTKVLFSQVYKFSTEIVVSKKYEPHPISRPLNLMDKSFSAKEQYKKLLISDRITYTPSSFFDKQTLIDIGGFDESNKFVEDYPLWLSLTKSGVLLSFMEKPTVYYRQHPKSLNSKSTNVLFNHQYIRTESMRNKYVYPNLPWDIVGKDKIIYIVSLVFFKLNINRNSSFLKKMYKLCTIYLNPFYYIYVFKRHFFKSCKNNSFYA